jgi:hypothetical protein
MTKKTPTAKPMPAAKKQAAKPNNDGITKAVTLAVAKAMQPSISMDASAKDVDKFIVSIKNRGAKLDHDIHSAAMACLNHADKHGDTTLMVRLLMALPKSTRRNALGQWAVAFGKFMQNPDNKALAATPLVFDKAGKTDLAAAQAKPFWDFRNVPEGTNEWQFGNFMEGVLKTLARHAGGTDAESLKAKAALDALQGVQKALAVPAQAAALPAGVKADRRAPDRPAGAAPVAPTIPAVH